MEKRRDFFDTPLLLFTLTIMIFCCAALYSAQKYVHLDENYFKKQIMWFAISLVIMFFIFFFDLESIMRLTPYIYLSGILLLIFVLVAPEKIAPTIKGAKSWIVVPGFASLQPSEFMKIFLIMMLAFTVTKHYEKYTIGLIQSDFFLLFKVGIIALIPICLTYMQNDFGTSLVMFVITMGIVLVSGINWRIIFTFVLIGTVTLVSLVLIYMRDPDLLLKFLDQYQLNRIHAWLDPFGTGEGIGYQLKQSILAVGSGMTSGKGFGQSNVYIPEAHTDFIFSIFAEEFGFIGASALIGLYFLIIYRIVAIALYSRYFEAFICTGVAALLAFHIFQNIGMVIGLIPITGIPLPLMSYGGSSVMATMMGISLILNISLKKKEYMFSEE
ncbi:MAG TPA: FtsW/RodA/SpoVE family cell cycle protein [Bacillaceae bacterium]